MLSNKFICAGYDYTTYTNHIPAPYFRKSFIIYSKPEKCTVTLTGLGFYDVYINGRKITKGLLAPYISNPDHIVYYDTYDITDYVVDGKNVLGIHLGNGMQNAPGGQIWDFEKADFRGAPRTAFCIEVTNIDGHIDYIEADRTVKTAPSPVIFDDLRCGCHYDARREIKDWAQIKFVDDDWEDAFIAETPRGERRLCEADPINAVRHINPISIRKITEKQFRPRCDVDTNANPRPTKEKNGYLYDFGVNSAGIVRLKISGERGRQIDLQYGEYIDNEGYFDNSNIDFYPDGYAQRDIYILKGEGEEIFEPVFTYHGFRYCVVYGITEEEATENLLTFIVCNSSLDELGGFRCSDMVANKLQAMTRNSDLSNFFYFPTDCPHREKNGWTGDAALSSEHILMNLKADTSYEEWLRNIRKAQSEDGSLPGIVPTAGWGYRWGNGPAWDAALTYIPYYSYILRGNKKIIEENAVAIFRYCQYISSKRDDRGLLEFGLGDWCPVTKVKSPLVFTDSVTCMSILNKASVIFDVLNMKLEKEFADKLYSEIRTAVRKYLIDFGSMTAIGNCQTSQAMAIYYNVFENGEKPEAFRKLLKILERNDNHIDMGILGTRVLFRVLSDFGECDLAYHIITRPDYPSYGNFVERGLTALPEDFKKDDEFPCSLNHHMFGDISAWFIEYIGGIKVNPYLRNSSEVVITPSFIKKLNNAVAYYKTTGGAVTVKWERLYSGIKLTVDVEDGVFGEIRLPDGYSFDDNDGAVKKLESGTYIIICDDEIPENIIEI